MTTKDETATDDVTEDDTVPTDKAKRRKELEKELAELGEDNEEVEGDVEEVEDAAEDAADKAAKKGPKDADEVEEQAEQAAGDIADEAEKAGVTLSAKEQESLASNIASKIYDKMQEGDKDEKAPRERKPDKRPQSTHFTERRLFGRKGR